MRKFLEWRTRQIEIGTAEDSRGITYWATCGHMYEGGFKTEKAAKNAIIRRIEKVISEVEQ